MAAHTAGPWGWSWLVDCWLWSASTEQAVLTPGSNGEPQASAEDQRLIAAAPDLLAALEAMRENYYDIDSRSLALADAAIAAATGN